jgi:hypothetical protein
MAAMRQLQRYVNDSTLEPVLLELWNRLSVAFRTVPGTYQPRACQKTAEAHV